MSFPNLALLGLPIYQAFVGPGLAAVFGIGGKTRLAPLLVAVGVAARSLPMIAARYGTYEASAVATVLLTTVLSPIAFPVVKALSLRIDRCARGSDAAHDVVNLWLSLQDSSRPFERVLIDVGPR